MTSKYWVRELPSTYVIEYKDAHGRDTFVLLSDDYNVMKFSTRAEAQEHCLLLNNEDDALEPTASQIELCERETGHAEVPGAGYCHCTHVMFD